MNQHTEKSEKRLLELIEAFSDGGTLSMRVKTLNDSLLALTIAQPDSSHHSQDLVDQVLNLTETINFLVRLHEEYAFLIKTNDFGQSPP